jgi:hypothetical protein
MARTLETMPAENAEGPFEKSTGLSKTAYISLKNNRDCNRLAVPKG